MFLPAYQRPGFCGRRLVGRIRCFFLRKKAEPFGLEPLRGYGLRAGGWGGGRSSYSRIMKMQARKSKGTAIWQCPSLCPRLGAGFLQKTDKLHGALSPGTPCRPVLRQAAQRRVGWACGRRSAYWSSWRTLWGCWLAWASMAWADWTSTFILV